MCSKLKRIFFPIVFTVTVLAFSTVVVYADVKLNKTDSLLSSQFSIDTYNSYMDSSKGVWGFLVGDTQSNMIHGVTNVLYSLQKIAWGFVDSALKFMFEADALKELTNTITEMTNQLWATFRDNYVPLVIVISLCMIGMTFVLKSSQQAIKQLGKLMLVLFLSMTWFANGKNLLTTFNDFASNLQADIMASAGNTDFMNDINTTDGDMTDSVTVIRNLYFDQVIQKPYYLMNYGTASAKEIEENSDFGNPNDLLRESSNEESSESIKQTYEKQSDSNSYLTPDKVTYKFTVAFFSSLTLVLYSLPLFVIAFCNLLLQLGALLMYYALPLLALISLIPQYSNAIINGMVKVIQLLLMKGVLGLGILVVSLLTLVVDTLFAPTAIAMFLLNMVVKGLTLIVSWKYRDKIMQVITNNLVQAASPKVINQNMAKARDKVEQKVSNIWNNRGLDPADQEHEAATRREDPDMVIHVRADEFGENSYQRTAQQSYAYASGSGNEDVFDGEFEEATPHHEERSDQQMVLTSEMPEESEERSAEVIEGEFVDVDAPGETLRTEQEVEVQPVYQMEEVDPELNEDNFERQEQEVEIKANVDQLDLEQSFDKELLERQNQEVDYDVTVNKSIEEVPNESTIEELERTRQDEDIEGSL